MRKLIYVMSKNGQEVMSTASYAEAEALKKEGYTASIKLEEIREELPKRAKELAERRWEKKRG